MEKTLYRQFADQCPTLPLFLQPHWLDAVVPLPNEWGVLAAKNEKREIIALLSYQLEKKVGGLVTLIRQPYLTQWSGIWFAANTDQRQALTLLVKELNLFLKKEKIAIFQQNYHFSLSDWLPFYWQKGYTTSIRYTYTLSLESPLQSFSHHHQRNLKKAKLAIKITETNDFEGFFEQFASVFDRQNLPNPIPKTVFQKLDIFLSEKKERTIYHAYDLDGNIHAYTYIVWDYSTMTAYHLASGSHVKLRKSGANYALYEHLIYEAKAKGMKTIDFLGSMLPAVESILRGFNAQQRPYFAIQKYGNQFWHLYKVLFIH